MVAQNVVSVKCPSTEFPTVSLDITQIILMRRLTQNSFTSFIHNTPQLDSRQYISYSAVWLLLQGLMYHWRQNYFVATIIILSRLDKSFVSTSILLLRQKTCFVATNTCKSLHAAKPHPRRVHQCSVSFLAVLRPPALLAE